MEEAPGPKKMSMDALPQQSGTEDLGEPASEMAVRRGKNRFMTGQSLRLPTFIRDCCAGERVQTSSLKMKG